MAEGLQIQIGANVTSAVQGLNQVQAELDQTAKGAAALGNSVERASAKIRTLPAVTNQATATLTNFSRVVQDAPFGIIGIANNIDPLVQSFNSLKATTGTTGGAFKALVSQLAGPAGIALAISTVTSLLITFSDKLFTTSKAAQKVSSDSDKLRDSINGIFSETAKEASAVNGFIAILRNETETRERKLVAIKELQQIQPQVFSGLKLEGEAVVGLDTAYKNYLDNLNTVIAVKIKQAQLEQLIEKQLKLQGVTLTANEKLLADGTKSLQEAFANDPRLQGTDAAKIKKYYTDQENQSKKTLAALQADILRLQDEITQLSKGIQTKPLKLDKVKVEPQKISFAPGAFDVPIEAPPEGIEIPIANANVTFENLEISNEIIRLKAQFAELGLAIPPINIQAVIQNPDILDVFNKQLSDTYTKLRSVSDLVGSAIAPAFDGLFSSIEKGGNAISGFFSGLADGIKQLVQALIQTAAIAGLVSLITGVPFAASFKAISGFTLPGRALGGPVSGGNPYLVGERGPELFVPQTSGSIVPNNGVGSFSGGLAAMLGGSGRGGTTLRGQDIILAYARTQRSQLRVNG